MDYDGFREFLAGMSRWAISDFPTPPEKDNPAEREKHSYFGNSVRRRENSLSPWGYGNPEPADHEFMRRLFRRWDVDMNSALTLQNVVTGIAHIKGKGDIMGSITYFFELYDDDGDGKVDREGILRISEALLFLSRRGLDGSLTPSTSMTGLSEYEAGNGGVIDGPHGSTQERFLSSVSAFIRRCFEYADPDHPQNQTSEDFKTNGNAESNAFGIGEDSDDEPEEDLLDLGTDANPKRAKKSTGLSSVPPPSNSPESNGSQRNVSKAMSERANAALDPSKPLHITLPTFRMVVLADELLEQFFESSFPASFRISEKLASTGPASSSSSLTTFSNIGFGRSTAGSQAGIGGTGSAGLVPPGKGLRGVLDNIVTDGMRVAAEVRRRMDEAQKELEKNAVQRPEDDEDEDEGYDGKGPAGGYGGDAERRSVRSEDRDLLEGADAEAGSIKGGLEGVSEVKQGALSPKGSDAHRARSISQASTDTQKVVEFER
jgi:hypothetical protein